ncbi:hypothetical protein, partial [Plasmodium yoelii yoelii]
IKMYLFICLLPIYVYMFIFLKFSKFF